MTDASLDQDVVARLERLLVDLPPGATDPTEFLLTCFMPARLGCMKCLGSGNAGIHDLYNGT